MDSKEAAIQLWRSLDVFGPEGSKEKEEKIRKQIVD
jgi:hypothetical protein